MGWSKIKGINVSICIKEFGSKFLQSRSSVEKLIDLRFIKILNEKVVLFIRHTKVYADIFLY